MRRQAWLISVAVALVLYWQALGSWFQQDDFAWLSLIGDVHDVPSLWKALFRPSQHGTWRPLGERAYFLFFPWAFGWEAWPMRALAFVTQCGSLFLSSAITLRLTRSELAAALAPLLWMVNSKMVIAMISNGAYIHILCGFFLLLALWCLMTERWLGMWIAFVVGFGAMETNIVFPALATTYCLAFARQNLRRLPLLWLASGAYWILHMSVAPKMASGSYAMHFGPQMLRTLARYWWWAFQPDNFTAFSPLAPAAPVVFGAIATAGLMIYTVWQACLKQFVPLLLLAWFVILIAPVLPLSGHVTDYYLTIPLAAFSMLAASAMRNRYVAVAGCAAWMALMIPVTYGATKWWAERSHVAQKLVRRVFAIHQLHPGKTLVLSGVTDEQFWAAVAHYPFLENGRSYVLLAPETRPLIQPHPESGVILDEFFAAADAGNFVPVDVSSLGR